MKLTPTRIERTLVQFNAAAVPHDHPSRARLQEVFGEHTFLLNNDGLHIVEPVASDTGKTMGQVVKLASWQDANRTSLTPHEPEPTQVVVLLDAA